MKSLQFFTRRMAMPMVSFLRRIAALFYDKNGENVPEGCHKGLLKKF